MKKAIIIGSSGFLGSAVSQELYAGGYQVFATMNRRTIPHKPGSVVIEGGIKSLTTGKINDINPDVIFHCARPVMPRLRSLGRVIASWQAGRLNRFLVDQIAASQPKPTLVFASGSLVYGNSDLPHNEDSPLKPVSYARQYHHGEQPILDAARETESRVIMLRFPWLLGDGSWFSWFFLKQLEQTGKVPLFGTGANRMSLISVKDAARLMVRCGSSDLISGIYNIFSPFSPTQKTFAGLVASQGHGTVTDYRNLFPGRIEAAVYEAFTSNILLSTKHPELLEKFTFQSPEEILNELMPHSLRGTTKI
jgi:nucleoside-diphosphate-sugar epimerase